jgi:hypothetical protein
VRRDTSRSRSRIPLAGNEELRDAYCKALELSPLFDRSSRSVE